MTAIVTKKSVVSPQTRLWIITFNLVVTDTVEVINKDYTVEFRTGDSIASKVGEVIAKMQADVDNYKSSKLILNNPQLDTAVTNIQEGLSL